MKLYVLILSVLAIGLHILGIVGQPAKNKLSIKTAKTSNFNPLIISFKIHYFDVLY